MAEAFLRLDAKDRLDALGVAAGQLDRPTHLLDVSPKLGGGSDCNRRGWAVHLSFTIRPYDLYSGHWRTPCTLLRKPGNPHRSTPSR